MDFVVVDGQPCGREIIEYLFTCMPEPLSPAGACHWNMVGFNDFSKLTLRQNQPGITMKLGDVKRPGLLRDSS